MVDALIRLLVLVSLVLAALTIGAAPAGASIVNLQTGTLATGTAGNVTPTLPSASSSGTLLVATLTNKTAANTFSAPAGWTSAVVGNNSCCGRAQIYYYANNPGGITSAAFTSSGGAVAGQLSEWNGVLTSSPLDQTGSGNHTAGSSFAISTSASLTSSGELGIAVYQNSGTGATSQTATSPWVHLFNDLTQNRLTDFATGLASGAKATDTESFSPSLSSEAVIATFKATTCTTGNALSLAVPGSVSFSGVTLNGTDQTVSTTARLTPDDETTAHVGWNVTGTSTAFSDAGGHTLPATATTITGASTSMTAGNCVMPTNSIGYPVSLPAGPGPPTAVKLFNAASGTGAGPTNIVLTFQLAVPANSYKGAYTSTWAFAIVSGP
jgi:hypothetical protein